jgi:hypothetical protein
LDGFTISKEGKISFAPTPEQLGLHIVTIGVKDSLGKEYQDLKLCVYQGDTLPDKDCKVAPYKQENKGCGCDLSAGHKHSRSNLSVIAMFLMLLVLIKVFLLTMLHLLQKSVEKFFVQFGKRSI